MSVWDDQYYEEEESASDDDQCPTCKGSGTVNPLTAPRGHFCTGVSDCPTCDGSGQI
jgi:DnaJ-class molecular chaperone